MSDDDNNVVQFPAGKPRVVQHEPVEVQPENTQNAEIRVPGSLDHMMFTDVPVTITWQHEPEHQRELWEIWDLCHQIQKQSMLCVHLPGLAKDLQSHLRIVLNQLTHLGNPNDSTEN